METVRAAEADGGPEAVRVVVVAGNDRYIDEITEPEVAAWIESSGLTPAEVARVQPSYCFDGPQPHPHYDAAMLTTTVAGARGGYRVVPPLDGRKKEPSVPLAIADIGIGALATTQPILAG